MLVLIGLMAGLVLRADESSDRKDKGYVTGSFETTTNYYNKDLKTGAVVPDAKSGSNNYLKADYYSNRFSAGIQMEVYAPVLLGYNADLKGAALTGYYLDWTDEDFALTENAVSGLEYASLMRENAEDVPLDRRVEKTLNVVMKAYNVPEEIREQKLRKVLSLDYRRIGRQLIAGFTEYVETVNQRALEEGRRI